MERHSVTALLSVGLLVILAWIGIALVGSLHGGAFVALIVIWAVVVAGLVGVAIWNLAEARRCRLERRSEATRDR